MSETPIHAEDGSPIREEAKTERPFNHPMSAYEKQEVDNTGEDGADSESESANDSRLSIVERMAQQADEDRFIAAGTRQEDMPMGEPVPEEGLQSREAIDDETGSDVSQEVDTDVDPLDAYVVEDENGQPLFKTIVNGEERYIPLDRAQAQLQKHESAEQRLQTANQIQQGLDQREAAIAEREQEYASRAEELNQIETPPVVELEMDDEELAAKAKDLVNGLFTGTEEDAAAKMVELLKSTRGAERATPAFSAEQAEQIAQDAAAAARKALSDDDLKKDVAEGFAEFQNDYPDLVADDMLFGMADNMTDTIAQEHPDWKPSKVMMEAGKRVREWVESKTGEKTPEQSEAPNVDRQNRKRNLRPMPTARQGTLEKEPETPPETPQSYMDEIRESRGQAV